MNLPASFKPTIKNTFYDKTITRYTSQDTKDGEGWSRKITVAVAGTFMANVSFDNLEQVQKDFGFQESVIMTLTTEDNIPELTIIEYLGRKAIVKRAKPYDSHYFLVAVEWSSKSLTSISA